MATKKKTTDAEKKEQKKEAAPVMATVTGDRPLNIRSGKTTDDPNIVGELKPGEKVEILKDGKLWCRIPQGYVMRQYLLF